MTKCPICRRKYLSPESLFAHLMEDHSTKVLVEELLKALNPMDRCGKRCFATQRLAESALVLNSISSAPNRRECRVYKCERCSDKSNAQWHLTSKESR